MSSTCMLTSSKKFVCGQGILQKNSQLLYSNLLRANLNSTLGIATMNVSNNQSSLVVSFATVTSRVEDKKAR